MNEQTALVVFQDKQIRRYGMRMSDISLLWM